MCTEDDSLLSNLHMLKKTCLTLGTTWTTWTDSKQKIWQWNSLQFVQWSSMIGFLDMVLHYHWLRQKSSCHVTKTATSCKYDMCHNVSFHSVVSLQMSSNGFVWQLPYVSPTLYSWIMPKRRCFCSDCNGNYRSWNTFIRHRTLHGTGKLWLVVFSILDKKET